MKKFLVVGGSGFLGSHLIKRLIDEQIDVTVSDIIGPESALRIKPYMDSIHYFWKSAEDLNDEDLVNVDCIVFLAAQADVPLVLSSPKYSFYVNTSGLINVLELLRNKQNTRLVYMSSKNVYGKSTNLPIVEEEPLRPTDPYGASKAAADLMCQSYSSSFGLPITIIRSSGLFGPYSRLQQAIPIFIKQALENSPITIEGDGSQSTDFNYVQNLVDSIISITNNELSGVYNIAYGKEYSVKEIVDIVLEKTNSSSSIKNLPWRSGEKGMKLSLSIDKAKRDFGYSPKVSFEEGIESTVQWLRNL
jgi:nucleoside-diphosphate-sugar epimerase